MSIPPYWKPYLDEFYEMVGDPVKDKALLAEESPVMHVDKIKTPLFVAQGAQDPRVNKAESDQMVASLKKRRPPEIRQGDDAERKPMERRRESSAFPKWVRESALP